MDGILGVIQSITRLNNVQVVKFIESLNEHQVFSHKSTIELNPTVQHIYDLLNKLETKHNGLLLLSSFLLQCPLDILEQKGTLWITLCTKICSQRKPVESIDLAYSVLTEILKRSVNTSDLSKSISGGLLTKIIETISTAPPTAFLTCLKFLEMAMLTYPGPCGPSRTLIEKFIISFVDSNDPHLVKYSAKCLQLLQQIRGGGARGLNYTQSWAQLQSQIVGSMNECLNAIFSNTTESLDTMTNRDRLNAPEMELSDEPIVRTAQLETRFVNLCKYLSTVLMEPFPVAKAIQPTKILAIISRGLAVNCITLSRNLIIDNIVVGTLLPRIHVALLNLLNALILVLKSNMLLYGKGVCQIVNQSLKWTANGKPNGFGKIFTSIRKATYHTLGLWCKTASYGSGIESIADDLIQQILQDIIPYQSEVTLTVAHGSKKFLSKKARQKLLKAQNEATNLAQTHSSALNPHITKVIKSDLYNEDLCASALKCLSNILLSTGCFLKPITHKLLQENIVALAINVSDTSATLKSTLYSSANCRLQLFGALHALIMSSNYLCPPPAQYAGLIFSLAQIRDLNPTVRDACNEYLRSIEKILHPQKQSLIFPSELNEIRAALQIINEGNVDSDEDDEEEEEENDEDEKGNDHTQTTISSVAELKSVENDVELSEPIVSSDENEELESAYETDSKTLSAPGLSNTSLDQTSQKDSNEIEHNEQRIDDNITINVELHSPPINVDNEISSPSSSSPSLLLPSSRKHTISTDDISTDEPIEKRTKDTNDTTDDDVNAITSEAANDEGDESVVNELLSSFVDELNEDIAE